MRFRLAAPPEQPLEIPEATTEVGTLRTASEESIVFQVSEPFTIQPARPTAYLVQRDGRYKAIAVADGVAHPQGPDRLPFGRPPQVDDALYLGFDEDISNLLLQVEIDGSMARGAGVKPDDPPLRWEMSQGGDRWAEAEVLADHTGGFNYGSGTVEVQCPADGAVSLGGRTLRWLRCRLDATRSGDTGAAYTHPPEIYSITAAPVGAMVPAEHARRSTTSPSAPATERRGSASRCGSRRSSR